MTAKPDLLPLPEWCSGCGESLPRDMQNYARANVAHATAAKDAEIEALRAEVAHAVTGMNAALDKVIEHRNARHDAEARAEHLAEALRVARDYVASELHEERAKFAGHENCSNIPDIEADLHKIDAALNPTAAQENDDA